MDVLAMKRQGMSFKEIGDELGYHPATIAKWVKQADLDEGVRTDGLTSSEREELSRLKRENKQLREEREILKKAAAWFARESDSLPKKGSSS